MPPTGRFAPTPSGPLHFGSLVAALASYCQAKFAGGRWILRIEDVDTPRVVAGASDQILRDLEAFAFEWDGPVLYQSDQFEQYQFYLEKLIDQADCYACECTRRSLREQGVLSGPLGQIYPGNCRSRRLPVEHHSIRMNTADAGSIGFEDQVYGHFELDLGTAVGDFVLRRADHVFAYHLAVVVDDELQGIDEVVRGADLLENTCLHLFLQHKLGFDSPRYMHIPLVSNAQGLKLSKQTGANPIDHRQATRQLLAALTHLGQSPDGELRQARPAEVIAWALENWKPGAIPARRPASIEAIDN